MPGGVLSATHDTREAGAALDTRRVVVAWLLGGVVPAALWYVFHGVAPFTADKYGPFATAFVDLCAVLFFLWTWPRVFGLSRLRPRVSDLAVGVLAGYLGFNVSVLIPAIPIAWPRETGGGYPDLSLLLFVCHVLVIPALEELIFRGVILGSLSKRTPVLWAVLITAVAAAVVHLPVTRWSGVFVAQLFLCGAYLARHRSIPASIAAHAMTNALCWWPNLVVAGYLLK